MAKDYQKVLNWLKAKRPADQNPKVKISREGDLYGNEAENQKPFPWEDEEVLKNFLGEVYDDGGPNFDIRGYSWDDAEVIINELSSQLNVDIDTKSSGLLIADKMGIINDATTILTGGKWAEFWTTYLGDDEGDAQQKRIKLIWHTILSKIFKEERYGGGVATTFKNLSQDDLVGETNYEFNTEKNEQINANSLVIINEAFFTSEFETTDMSQESEIINKLKVLDSLNVTKEKQNAALRQLATKKQKELELLADLETEAEEGDEDFEKRKEFFKKIEQCILLNIVDKLGNYNKNEIRKKSQTVLTSGTGRGPDAYKEDQQTKIKYGSRIHCIDVDENMYSNYATSDGEIWNYSKNYLQKYASNVSYSFIISKMQTVDTGEDGDKEIEMPLLFESGENFLHKGDRGAFSGIKIFADKASKSALAGATVEDFINSDASSANSNIKFEDISIKFHGENQATAKSNVDVDLTISLPSLLLFQTEFSSTTFYTKDDGTKEDYPYTYSLVDLISYLHRTDLGDVYKSLNNGGARLYNPKFFRSYNRLAMKIVPNVATEGITGDAKFLEIKEHLDNNPLILDLALIDHTIEKESENQNAKIKISYKGYIKSFMQNPKFDIIRTDKEIIDEINKEKDLIEKLTKLNDKDAIKEIDNHNKLLREETQKRVTSITLFNDLIVREKMYFYSVQASDFSEFVSKDFELLSTNTISQNFSEDKINIQLSTNTGKFGDAIKDKVNPKATFQLKFFYLGDLIHLMLDNYYSVGLSVVDKMSDFMRDFPLKIILPSFNPLTTDSNGDRVVSNNKISLADIPISYEWFANWYIEEFVESEVDFYTVGTLINRLVSDVVNGFLIDECYLQGSHNRKSFATKAEFGLFNKTVANNSSDKQQNITWFTRKMKGSASADLKLTKADAPFFKKDPKIPRIDHCNFIFVYPQIAVFSDFKGVEPNETSWEEYNVPELANSLVSKIDKTKESIFTKTISFSKEEANYRREARFQSEKLYTLAQLASVYNVTVDTFPCLDLFPGMLCWVNAGLYQSPAVLNSIANILGMGGYHLIESITHSGQVDGTQINSFKTQITANWISNGSIKLEGETPEEKQVEELTIDSSNKITDSTSTTIQSPTAEELSRTKEDRDFNLGPTLMGRLNRGSGKKQILLELVIPSDGNTAQFLNNDGKTHDLKKIKVGKNEFWGYVASDYDENKKISGNIVITEG